MHTKETLQFATTAITSQRMRSGLTVLGIAVGIMTVVLLTSIGEGLHRYVMREFTQFGSNIIGIHPGKVTTMGASVGIFGNDRPLSIQDALSLQHLSTVVAVMPTVQGNAQIEANQRQRRATVYGVNHTLPLVMQLDTQMGNFLPADDPLTPRAFAVLGSKLKRELFSNENALGKYVRVGGARYQIIGVMAEKGQVLGIDLDDSIYIPVIRAMQLFNRESLMEIDVIYHEDGDLESLISRIKEILTARHGREDFTLITQKEMLMTLEKILGVLKFAVGALGSISLFVGAIGILTIMTIAVTERRSEVGLMRALGATRRQIQQLFLVEAALLGIIGGVVGLCGGITMIVLMKLFFPGFPVNLAWDYVVLAVLVSLAIGVTSGIFPAIRAAGVDPVLALQAE